MLTSDSSGMRMKTKSSFHGKETENTRQLRRGNVDTDFDSKYGANVLNTKHYTSSKSSAASGMRM